MLHRRPVPRAAFRHGSWYATPRNGRLATPAPPASRSPNPPNTTQRSTPDATATARPTLAAEHREITGKAVSRLRRAGKLPAVVYGHGVDSSNVTVDAHDFEQLRKHTGANALVDLSVDGAKAQPVLVNGVQVHPVNRRPLHVDLFLVRMTEELTVDVPLIATGESPRSRISAARSSTRPRPSGSGRCPTTCRSRSSTRSSRSSTSTGRSTSATWSSPPT